MKIWMRLTLLLAALLAGTAFAMWGEAFSSPDSGSAGSEARQEPSGGKELVENPNPGPCGCPVGFECIPTPRVGFVTPVEGDTFRAGETANIEVFACDLFALGLGTEDSTNLSVTCPGVSLTTSEKLVQVTPSGAGTCELLVTAGAQQFRGKSLGLEAKLSVPVVSTAPSVAFTWPTPDLAIVEGNLVQLSATATDSDGSVVSVTFQVRNRSTQAQIFTQVDSSAPYGANLPWTAPGNYVATARALDNEGNETQTSVHFSVNARPTITFVQPVASSFTAPANVVFEVSAADSDGSIKRVDFELINTVSGQATRSSDSLPPYTHPANGLAAASYRMRAWAFDNQDGWREATRDITVSTNPPPVVALTSPTQNQLITAPGAIELRATATDNGSITSVEFRHGAGGATLIGSGVAAGGNAFTFNWAGVPVGDYQVIARVRDNDGAVVDSAPRTLQVRTNTAPSAARLITPWPEPRGIYLDPTIGPEMRYSQNSYPIGSLMPLEARFDDAERNIRRIDFYRNSISPANLLATVSPTAPPQGQTRVTANAEIAIVPAMDSLLMQRVFAVASDGEFQVSTASAPVAFYNPTRIAGGCSGSGPGCGSAFHPIPGIFEAERYDTGGAGISYFEKDPFMPRGSSAANPRGDDVEVRDCGVGGLASGSCVVGRRSAGEWLNWSMQFSQGGQYRLFFCVKDHPETPVRAEAEEEPLSVAVRFGSGPAASQADFEQTDYIAPSRELFEAQSARGELTGAPTRPCENGVLSSMPLGYTFSPNYRGTMTLTVERNNSEEWIALDWMALFPESQIIGGNTVVLDRPVAGQQFVWGSPITLHADVQTSQQVSSVVFHYRESGTGAGWNFIGGANSAPYTRSWTPPGSSALGSKNFEIKATAVINNVGSVETASPTQITVTSAPANLAPTAIILQPSAGNIAAGSLLALSASATDSDGQVSRVEFRITRNGVAVGDPIAASNTAGAWRAQWQVPAAAGSYQIIARAFDSATPQLSGDSAPVVVNTQTVPGLAHETPVPVPSSVAAASDGVGATAGTFRVDETGSATYSIPLAVVPGRAGVAPEMALAYSSQGGMGVMGRGWSISGASAITRCRQTAEAGDGDALQSGSPPLGFGESDRYCLDGQRLMLVVGSYAPNAATMEFRTEIDSFARIRAFNTDGVNGPNYFVVQAKDGTTSWYGDSINREGLPFLPTNFATEERTDAALRRNDGSGQSVERSAAVLSFALARRMDSFGNYIDYRYDTNQEQGEQLLSRVEYTGKTVLTDQGGQAAAPFAALRFNYEDLPANQQRSGWQAGMRVRASKRLISVDSLAKLSTSEVIRQYRLNYDVGLSLSGERVLTSLRECSGTGGTAVCYPPTTFGWTRGSLRVDDFQNPPLAHHSREQAKAHQLGDVDGDGLMDLVWFNNDRNYGGPCTSLNLPSGTQRIVTGFGTVLSSGAPKFAFPVVGSAACSLRSYTSLAGAWYLFDYNGDGRDDLMLADREPESNVDVNSWQIYASRGRFADGQVFNQGQGGSAGLLPTCPQRNPNVANSQANPDAPGCLPVNRGPELLMQLVDLNGDGLQDAVYGSPIIGASGADANVIKFKLMQRTSNGLAFSSAYTADFKLSGNEYLDACAGGAAKQSAKAGFSVEQCRIRFLDANSRAGRSPTPVDLNGDGRGDLLLQVEVSYLSGELSASCRAPTPEEASSASSMWAPTDAKHLDQLLASSARRRAQACTNEGTHYFTVAASVDEFDHAARSIKLSTYHAFDGDHIPPQSGMLSGLAQPRPADFNGDGLVDLVFNHPWGDDRLQVFMNAGDGFVDLPVMDAITARDHIQLLDFDGDGRTDLLHPSGSGDNAVWRLRRGEAQGGISPTFILPDFWFGNTPSATRLDFNPGRSLHFFADFDGDGKFDVLEVPGPQSSSSQTRMIRSGSDERFKPLAHINTITNGYGAVTEITYQPLTNGAVYLREPGSRAQSASIGNGSPVQDLLGGMYVVSRVASDAPGLGNSARRSELLYQYRGARMQAGGRGMLGFREVRTIDANFDPGAGGALNHIVSITEYGLAANDPEAGVVRYGFPYIGMPRESRQYRVSGAVPSGLRNCLLSGPEQTSGHCFNASGFPGNSNTFFDEPAGTLLSYARNRLAHAVTVTGIAGERSVFPYIQASFEAKGNPEATGIASLSETVNLFNYQTAWGDLANSEVSTANGASYSGLAALRTEAVARVSAQTPEARCPSARCVTRVSTVNTWLSSSQPTTTSDLNYWRLGRLEKSRVTHWRQGAHAEPASTLTRESRFAYDMDSVTRTGALTVERVAGLLNASSATAPNDSPSELKTIRQRDAYGNVTDTFVCSGDVPDSTCQNPSQLLQRPAGSSGLPLTRVHRHTRTEYDSQGRYPVRTLSPHFDGTPDGALYALETVQSRDALGNVMQTNRLNGGSATATYGPLGRQQTSEDSTGAKTVSEFHWCVGNGISGQVAACPSDLGAVFRQTAYTYGGTRSVTYFDRLGREVFALSESFNRYDENAANDWVGVCKTYDGRGRTVAVTEPFFVGNVATSGLRPELSTAVGCASKPSTRTTYDVLDRALTIRLPEDIGGTTVARTEMEYQGLSTTTRTYLSRATTPFATPTVVTLSEVKLHDPTGLVLTVTDAEGLEAKYAHDAAGNLVALKRNAGNGDIVSRIGYDALGRKISQNDPDAGTASYAYNAAGELICSQDARGYATITDFDALGRSWRSRSLRSSCASNTTAAITVSNADASILPSATTGDHSSVDLTVYDLAANGVGQIESTLRRHRVGSTYAGYRGVSADQGEFQQTSAYDSFGRPSQVSTRFREPNLGSTGLVERSFTQRTTYDALGRVATTQDATGGVVENMYSAHGFLRRVRDAGQPSLVFWELLETDVRGQTTLDRRHGKVELTQQRQYNEVTGRLARIITGTWSNNQIHSAVQNLSYVFDAQGNLLSRKDERANGREEVFVYDRLNRLIEARLSGASPSPADGLPTLTLSYDKLGNICSKNGVGYTYAGRSGCGLNGLSGGGSNSGASPHAVTARGAQAYQYDAAGNMTRTTGHNAGPGFTSTVRDVRFDGAGNADRLSISDQSTSFWYAGGGRYLRLDESSDAPAKLTRYLGGVEWILRGGGAEERRRSIGGFLLLTESVTAQQPTPTRKYRYLLADHLGSTDTLVDENGVVVERMSFDAHGSRRAAASGTGMWASLLPAVAPTEINPQVNAETTRGFTGHEHVDRMGLIHMNGRLYDPLLGRMLSPDPIVQEPYNAQNLNRYSYVLNNPLSYTDPSGLSFVKKYWRAIVAAAITIFAPYLGPWTATWWGAATIGFVSGTVATGSLEGGLWGAFSAGLFNAIGSSFQGIAGDPGTGFAGTGLTSTQFAGKVLSHATAGGVMSVMQGGKFGHGFASAGITQAFAPGIDGIDRANTGYSAARVIAAAMVGGTASVASGGKFANGAITGAFSRAFNDESHRRNLDRRTKLSLRRDLLEQIAHREFERLNRFLDGAFAIANDVFDLHVSFGAQASISGKVGVASMGASANLFALDYEVTGNSEVMLTQELSVNFGLPFLGEVTPGFAREGRGGLTDTMEFDLNYRGFSRNESGEFVLGVGAAFGLGVEGELNVTRLWNHARRAFD